MKELIEAGNDYGNSMCFHDFIHLLKTIMPLLS